MYSGVKVNIGSDDCRVLRLNQIMRTVYAVVPFNDQTQKQLQLEFEKQSFALQFAHSSWTREKKAR